MTVAALHQALANPGMYPEPTTRVEVRETHISLVYLTDHYAYKVKKPVNFGFVDYSTLAQRQALCQQELLLNRRLSSAVYLDVVPIYYDGKRYTFTVSEEVADYAVKMRRLSADTTLAALLTRQQVTPADMQEIARVIADFMRPMLCQPVCRITAPMPPWWLIGRKIFSRRRQALAAQCRRRPTTIYSRP